MQVFDKKKKKKSSFVHIIIFYHRLTIADSASARLVSYLYIRIYRVCEYIYIGINNIYAMCFVSVGTAEVDGAELR